MIITTFTNPGQMKRLERVTRLGKEKGKSENLE
jgi:hypothetical protein